MLNLKKQLAKRMLPGELAHHLHTEAALDILRDRLATFEPQLMAK
jgi:hypothetical protein